MTDRREMPMFPLGTVLFPYASLPLHVFEPRYRVMVRDLLDGDGEFGIVLIERGHEVGGGDVRFDVGTIAPLVHAEELPDGRFALGCVGVARAEVHEWLPDDPYPRAIVGVLDERGPSAGVDVARTAALESLERVYELVARLSPRVELPDLLEIADDAARASYECCRLAPVGALDAQRLLEAADATARFRALAELLDDAAVVLRAQLGDR